MRGATYRFDTANLLPSGNIILGVCGNALVFLRENVEAQSRKQARATTKMRANKGPSKMHEETIALYANRSSGAA